MIGLHQTDKGFPIAFLNAQIPVEDNAMYWLSEHDTFPEHGYLSHTKHIKQE